MISEELAMKASYQNPDHDLVYGLGSNIMREYDMNSAGLSVIREFGLLGKLDIARLETMEKLERNILIGKIRALDKDWSKNFTRHIRETMAEFMRINGVEEENLISINNDAITVIEPRTKKAIRNIGSITFKLDGEFSCLALINRVCIFVNKGFESLTIRGIGENGRSKSMDGLGSKFLEWLRLLESGEKPINVLKKIKAFRTGLLEHSEPIEMYRSLRTGYLNFLHTTSKYTTVKFNGSFDDKEWEMNLDPTESLQDFIIPFQNLIYERYRTK